jgi:two-component system chemotaxis response regulator CheB
VSRLRIGVAADSLFHRQVVAQLLAQEPGMEVVGMARSNEELLRLLEQRDLDAVFVDLTAGSAAGARMSDALVAWHDIAVLLAAPARQDVRQAMAALGGGAIRFVDPRQCEFGSFVSLRAQLAERTPRAAMVPQPPPDDRSCLAAAAAAPPVQAGAATHRRPGGDTAARGVELVVLGASAGGPEAVERVLRDLGGELRVPVAIAQHMPPAFTRGFARRLDGSLPLKVEEVRHGEPLLAGVVYLAPGDCNLRIERRGEALRAALAPLAESAPYCPSVDALFASAGAATSGRLLSVLLTGMGCDGAAAMARLAGAGVHTIAQDEATSAIFGMPRAAIEAGGATEVLPLQGIGSRLLQLIQR